LIDTDAFIETSFPFGFRENNIPSQPKCCYTWAEQPVAMWHSGTLPMQQVRHLFIIF